jgi:hypothetical protein
MFNFKTYSGAPALCASCGALDVVNYLKDDPRCATCGGTVRFYSDPELQEQARPMHPPARAVFLWSALGTRGPLVLPDVGYLCLHCRQKTLRFESVLLWDSWD